MMAAFAFVCVYHVRGDLWSSHQLDTFMLGYYSLLLLVLISEETCLLRNSGDFRILCEEGLYPIIILFWHKLTSVDKLDIVGLVATKRVFLNVHELGE